MSWGAVNNFLVAHETHVVPLKINKADSPVYSVLLVVFNDIHIQYLPIRAIHQEGVMYLTINMHAFITGR